MADEQTSSEPKGLGSFVFLKVPHVIAGVLFFVAALPGLGLTWMTVSMVRYVRRVDEFVRRIELEAIGIAALIVAQAYLIGGLLQLARVISVSAASAMVWVFPLLCLCYGVAKFFVRRHYR